MAIKIEELVNKILDVINTSPYARLDYDSNEAEEIKSLINVHKHNLIFDDTKKVYAVTGEQHGSIITAYTKKEAKIIFQEFYKYEKIWNIKEITEHNLGNL